MIFKTQLLIIVDDDDDDDDDDDRRVNGQQVSLTGRTFKSPQRLLLLRHTLATLAPPSHTGNTESHEKHW